MSERVALAVGSKVYISRDLPDEQISSAYKKLSFTLIKGLRDAGNIDERHITVNRSPLGLDYSYQERVGLALPTLTWDMVKLSNSAGQALLFNAFNGAECAFCIEHTDGTLVFFIAAVSARSRIIADSSTVLAWRYELDLQSKPVQIEGESSDAVDGSVGGWGKPSYTGGCALEHVEKSVGGTAIVEVGVSSFVTLTLNATSCFISLELISDLEASDKVRTVSLRLIQGTGSNKAFWMANISWAYGREPVLSYERGAFDMIKLTTLNDGLSWIGSFESGWHEQ